MLMWPPAIYRQKIRFTTRWVRFHLTQCVLKSCCVPSEAGWGWGARVPSHSTAGGRPWICTVMSVAYLLPLSSSLVWSLTSLSLSSLAPPSLILLFLLPGEPHSDMQALGWLVNLCPVKRFLKWQFWVQALVQSFGARGTCFVGNTYLLFSEGAVGGSVTVRCFSHLRPI